MTTVVSALDRAARQVSIDPPTSWVTASDDEHLELRDDFMLETVEDIRDRIDWARPIAKIHTLTGTGAGTYTLPSNFVRLQRGRAAVYETTTVRRAMIPAVSDDYWTHLQEIGSTGADRYYQVRGYEGNYTISIYREPAASISVEIHYISDVWVVKDDVEKSKFTDPSDVLLFPRRLIEAGVVWRYRERKGLDPTAKFAEYETLLGRYSADLRGRREIVFGDRYANVRPWDVPVPDQIPTS